MSTIISLNGNDWHFKDFYGEDWNWRKSVQPDTRDLRWWRNGSVPGCVHHDLWMLGEIPDPYFERNSLLCEWVPARTWIYKKKFSVVKALQGKRVRLHFEGVDYQAQFFLNGEHLGDHTGMFTPAVFDVSNQLVYGQENLIAVVIEAAPVEQPQVGYTSRVQTVKSRMPYWWDFCPRMVQLGIWDDVYLSVTGPVLIANTFIRPRLTDDFQHADVSVSIALDSAVRTILDLEISLYFAGVLVTSQQAQHTLEPGSTTLQTCLEVEQPHLWWPNGCGEQNRYEVEVRVLSNGVESASRRIAFGIRQVRLEANETADPAALPYTFVVNGRKLYIKGWNWVPMDVMYGVPRPEKLERLLTLAQRAHVNMLRVWGGGLIEQKSFYDLCDRLGLMVWQEFIQSSSGIDNHPATSPAYIQMVVDAAEQIIPRKRNHPSLVLWCGGNELQSGPEAPLDDTYPTLAVLKSVVQRLDPDRLWLPTSSSGRVFSNSLENIARDPSALHDVHGPWEYQGVRAQYELYNQGASLFHSEFGVEGITNLPTLNAVIAPEHQLSVTLNNPFWYHLGAWWVKRPMWDQTFGELADVATLARATQFLQAEGLRYALEADRRRKYHNSGTLPWQFNEPYPMAACTSAVDYYAHPKPVYYAVLHAYEPLHLSAKFPTVAWEGEQDFHSEIWINNSGADEWADAVLQTRLVGASGQVITHHSQPVSIGANRAAQLASLQWPLVGIPEDVFFLDLLLMTAGGTCRSQNRYIFSRTATLTPLLHIPPTQLLIQREQADHTWRLTLTNTGAVTALFVWLEQDRPSNSPGYGYMDDNHFCLFPGEARTVTQTWQGGAVATRQIRVNGWNTDAYLIREEKG